LARLVFAASSGEVNQTTLTAAELCQHHLIVTPPPARLSTTMTRWFNQMGVPPQRLSMCNSLSVTALMIKSGLGIGLVPRAMMRGSVAQGELHELRVEPMVAAHQVWICYQVEELGPGLQQVVELMRNVAADHGLFA
jgi:DNA-binding transcriptional LysR family regulator